MKKDIKKIIENREICYKCYRPQTSCMCKYITKIKTNTKFIILMHPKEFRKTKNGTGHFTNLSLVNSEIFIGIDFTNNDKINSLIDDEKNNCFILYPDKDSINLNNMDINKYDKTNIIFIIDSTWACATQILNSSINLHNIPKISFTHTKISKFKIKTQPNKFCLSTMESTLSVLELLVKHNIENISKNKLELFLKPFEKMVEYQLSQAKNNNAIRYKVPYKSKYQN
jgi:DTW domain-containing protein YfiP